MDKGWQVRGRGLLQVLEKERLFLIIQLVTIPLDVGWRIAWRCWGEAPKD